MPTETTTPHQKTGINISAFALEIILLVIIGFLAFFARGFATWDNFLNILRNASTTGIIAFGMTFVIISGEIDLSVGSAIAFHGCLLAVVTEGHRNRLFLALTHHGRRVCRALNPRCGHCRLPAECHAVHQNLSAKPAAPT